MTEGTKFEPKQNLVGAINEGVQLWQHELNGKIGHILRQLEVFEDENSIYCFYRNDIVGEISCTWQKSGKWEKAVNRQEVEGLNFVNPKRFFQMIFGDQQNFKTWLLQNFCDFCLWGLNQNYQQELKFAKSPKDFRILKINADDWNLALLGEKNTSIHQCDKASCYNADENLMSSELIICRFNYEGNYSVDLYLLKKGEVTSMENFNDKLYFSGALKNVDGFYYGRTLLK